jgi:hypothetical protein
MKTWEYCWLHWSTAQIAYMTGEGELQEVPAQKDPAAAVANLGLVGWELVNVDATCDTSSARSCPTELRLHGACGQVRPVSVMHMTVSW